MTRTHLDLFGTAFARVQQVACARAPASASTFAAWLANVHAEVPSPHLHRVEPDQQHIERMCPCSTRGVSWLRAFYLTSFKEYGEQDDLKLKQLYTPWEKNGFICRKN